MLVAKPSIPELTRALRRYEQEAQRKANNRELEKSSIAFTDNQVRYEAQKLIDDRRCKSDGSAYLPVFDGLNQDTISQKLKTDFMNMPLLEGFRCILDKVLDTTGESGQSLRMGIQEYMNGLIGFGAESVNGFAMRTGMIANRPPKGRPQKRVGRPSMNPPDYHRTDVNGTIVMKCPRAPAKSNEMAHEVVIGLEGLNELREIVPNFSYVFGAPELGTPVFSKDKQSLGWANQDRFRVRYALYENIGNSIAKTIPIGDVDTAEALLLYYLQVICSLKLANAACDFTHYDAHDENVLIRPVSSSPFYITYSVGTRDAYVKSPGSIATFIDYGMSHIVTKDNRHIGILDKTGYFRCLGIRPDESNVISDAYKLVCMLLMKNYERLAKTNSKDDEATTVVCLRIVSYFFGVDYNDISIDDINTIINGQWNMRFHVPLELTGRTVNGRFVPYWDLDGLIAHCVQIANEFNPANVVFEKPANVLGRDMVFPSNKTVLKELKAISDFSVPVPDAYELFKASDDPKQLGRLTKALADHPELSLERERANCAELLNYKYRDSFQSLDHTSRAEITRHLPAFMNSIKGAYGLIDALIRLKDKIREVAFCVQLSPVFSPLLGELRTKSEALSRDLAKTRPHIVNGQAHLKTLVYGTGDVDDPSKTRDGLYPLWDVYRNAIASLTSLA